MESTEKRRSGRPPEDLKNEIRIELPSLSINEGIARSIVSSFISQLDPTFEELCDIKCAVSEAVTNCIVHAYRDRTGWITLACKTEGNRLHIEISDDGAGIEDVDRALEPFFTTLESEERSGMGFTIMQSFMDEFSVSSATGKGTKVTMRKDFATGSSDAGRS